MKAKITVLHPELAELIDEYIERKLEENMLNKQAPHEFRCQNCLWKALKEYWESGKNEELFKDLPEGMEMLQVGISTHAAVFTDESIEVEYKGEIVDATDIPGVIEIQQIFEEGDEGYEKPKTRKRVRRGGIEMMSFDSPEEFKQFILNKILGRNGDKGQTE